MNKLKIVWGLLSLLLVASCYGPRAVNRAINKEQYPVSYLYESPRDDKKVLANVKLTLHDNTDTTNMSIANKDRGYLLFLLLVYTYDYDYSIKLGKNSVYPELSRFFAESFKEETERKGNFAITNSAEKFDFELKISLEDYNVLTKHHSDYFSIAGAFYKWNHSASPSNGYLHLNIELTASNGKSLLAKEYIAEKTTDFISEKSNTSVLNDLMINMAETLSECVQLNINDIIDDLNREIEKQITGANL